MDSENERRIYVVVAKSTHRITSYGYKFIVHPAGRVAAQVSHVVSKMRHGLKEAQFTPITTIVLSVDTEEELWRILLGDPNGTSIMGFYDTNDDAYGDNSGRLTAICTKPILQSEVPTALADLPLYSI